MTFDELHKQLLKEYAIEEGLFKAIGGVADKAIGAVARDIAPKATGAVDATASAVADGFGRGDKKGKKGKKKEKSSSSSSSNVNTKYTDDKEGQDLLSKALTSLGITAPVDVDPATPAEEKLATLDKLEALGYGYPIKIGDIDYHYDTHNTKSLTTFDESGRRKIHPIEGLEFEVYPDYNQASKEQDTPAQVNAEPAEPAKPEEVTFEPESKVTYTNKKGDVKTVTYIEDLGNGKSEIKFARGMTMAVSNDQLQESEPDAFDEEQLAKKQAKKNSPERRALSAKASALLAKKRGEGEESVFEDLSNELDSLLENFKDGKKKGKSRPGRVKKSGASCNGSVTELRKKAKNASGEKAKMYHWCANMKGGKKKSESEEIPEEDAEKKKKVSKLRAKCQAKAKRKYDVWPSAYASGYVQKCVNRGGKIK